MDTKIPSEAEVLIDNLPDNLPYVKTLERMNQAIQPEFEITIEAVIKHDGPNAVHIVSLYVYSEELCHLIGYHVDHREWEYIDTLHYPTSEYKELNERIKTWVREDHKSLETKMMPDDAEPPA